MPKRGGQTTQSGILYQNSVAALFLGLLCDSRERPQEEQALQIRVESPDNVDDIVVTFADQHRLFIQAKENINPSDIIWKELWQNFEEEYFQQDFRRELDFLKFQVGTERAVIRDLHEVCERALTSTKPTEWKNSLSKKQLGLLEKVKSILSPRLWDDDAILMFFKQIKVEIWTLTHIEHDLVNYWMPGSNKSPIHLFRLLRDRVGGEARRGGSFIAADLRRSINEEDKGFIFLEAPDVEVLKQKIKSISSVLHQHKNTWGQTGIHLRRSISHEIALWLTRNKIESTNNVGFLVDQAGMGKTVVMRDILEELELTSVIVLALKVDQQLSDVSGSRDLFDKYFSPWSMEQVINRLSKKERVVVLIDQIDALSLTLAHDEKALNLLIDMIAKLRRIPNVCILISCRLFDIHSDPRLNQIEFGQRFNIKRLSEEEIRNALSLISFNCSHLSKATFELLTTPLHLSLFIQAIQSGWTDPNEIYGASSLQELYASIWRYVIFSPSIKTPPESERKETIDFITNYMDDEQTIIIPQSVLFVPEKQRLQNAINWLASIGIIAESKNGWTFFHQTFFDYCYARKFVDAGGNIVEEILKSPQGLIERSKLIQVFTYLRGYRNSAYLKQYDSLVTSSVLRFHLQDLLIRWFGSIPNPYEAETNYFLHCILTQEKRNQYLTTMFGNLQWFAFMQSSILPKWLSSDDDEFIDTYVIPYLISMVEINQLRVVQLIAPFLEMGEKWQRRIYSLITRIQKWVCIEAAQLMVKLVEKLHVVHRQDWYDINNVAKAYPQIGCQLLNITFNAALDEFTAKKQEAETDQKKSQYFSLSGILDQLDNVQLEDAIRVVSDAEPLLLLDIWIAWLDKYYSLLPISPKDSPRYSWDEFYEHWNEEMFRISKCIYSEFDINYCDSCHYKSRWVLETRC